MKAAIALLCAVLAPQAASAATFVTVAGPAVAAGEDLTQTIRISGLDPMVDSVTLQVNFDVDFGLNWFEDFDGELLEWGNEYFHGISEPLTLGDSKTGGLTVSSSYGFDLFVFEWWGSLATDGSDIVATLRLNVGDFDLRCADVPEAERVEFAYCGVRPFGSRNWENALTIEGPNEQSAMVSSRIAPTVVPEPAAWAMMIAGFGAVGLAARRRRAVA